MSELVFFVLIYVSNLCGFDSSIRYCESWANNWGFELLSNPKASEYISMIRYACVLWFNGFELV